MINVYDLYTNELLARVKLSEFDALCKKNNYLVKHRIPRGYIVERQGIIM